MSDFLWKHKILRVFIIIVLILLFFDVSNYLKRMCQIGGYLNEKYGNLSYSVKGVQYTNEYGPLTELIPFNNKKDIFYLHDNTYDFDFTVSINRQASCLYDDDNYTYSYCGKRVDDICLNNISVPDTCKVSFLKSEIITTDESLQALKELSDDEIVEMLAELKNNGHSGVHYKGVALNNSSIELNIAINGNEKDAQETAYQIYNYMVNAFNETYISELTINNRTVIKKQWFGMNTDSHIYGHDQYFLNKEEFMELIS
ncbi:MAG: hypothetical protein ACI4XP_01730 [Acutalibacteraceae bacterium]